MECAVLGKKQRIIITQLPVYICDSPSLHCSTNGAIGDSDACLESKQYWFGSIPLVSKASRHTCLESEWHVIDVVDSCTG